MNLIEKKKPKAWPNTYWNQIQRNIGLVSIKEQQKIKDSRIAIFGLGGLGGPLAEQLVRSGCEHLVICDYEKFDESNLNRQICSREDLNKYKVDVTEKFLLNINPDVEINKFYLINENNISKILKNVDIATLLIDDIITSIIISRNCSNNKIPLIESWGIPYLCSWWFNSESLDFESYYGLNTKNLSIDEIKAKKDLNKELYIKVLNKLLKFPEIKLKYNREEGIMNGMLTKEVGLVSIAPIVRLTASFIAFDIIFSGILNLKRKILAPKIIGFDYFKMKYFEIDLT